MRTNIHAFLLPVLYTVKLVDAWPIICRVAPECDLERC